MTPGDLGGVVVVLALCCLWHAVHARGVRSGLAFLAVAVAVSWSFEEIGVVTGLVFGRYHYTATLGPWVGSVPLVIPLAWFALAYPTWAVARYAATRWPVRPAGGPGAIAAPAMVGAALMAGWDLALDPILSGPDFRAWSWGAGPAAGAVPIQNSLGWTVTALVIFVLIGAMERRPLAPDASSYRVSRRRPGHVPTTPRAARLTSPSAGALQKDDRQPHGDQGDPHGLAEAPADGQGLLGEDEQRHDGHRGDVQEAETLGPSAMWDSTAIRAAPKSGSLPAAPIPWAPVISCGLETSSALDRRSRRHQRHR